MPRGVYPREPYVTRPFSERFWSKVDRNGPTPEHRPDLGPCWLWRGTVVAAGYGVLRVGSRQDGSRRNIRAHRVAYESLVSTIPTGLVLDHLCRVRLCVNPGHLEAVTDAVNIKRGEVGKHHRSKTHCRNGHSYDSENTYTRPNGSRYCRTCNRSGA